MDYRVPFRSRFIARLRHYAARLGRADADGNPDPVSPLRRAAETGQALILIAVAFVVLLGFVGLTTDVGQLFIYMGHLRRATDAASLAAAAQYREGRTLTEMTAAAGQVMSLNGIDPASFSITVQTCDTNPTDPALCTTPRRKLVRINSTLNVPMTFLVLVGVRDVPINFSSIGEAASLDVVLVIDVSESMAWNGTGTMRDASVCNASDADGSADGFQGDCQPFQEVKRAAVNFANRVLNKPAGQEEDRLAIVSFASGWDANHDRGTFVRTAGWTSDNGTAVNIIQNLQVYQPGTCWTPANYDPQPDPPTTVATHVQQFYGPCRRYAPDSTYMGLYCLACYKVELWPLISGVGSPPGGWTDYSSYTTTNIGGGLLRAGNMFALQPRENSLWVVVLLTDGAANATDMKPGDNVLDWGTYPVGYCPNPNGAKPICQDHDVTTRHSSGSTLYDADDYARDMADFVGCAPTHWAAGCHQAGQGAVMFTVGLGAEVLATDNEVHSPQRAYGAELLRYIARVGYAGDPDPAKDPCRTVSDYTSWCGNYYYSPQGPQLSRIFEDIASRIFTRLTH